MPAGFAEKPVKAQKRWPPRKLTDEEEAEVMRLIQTSRETIKSIAARFGVSRQTIYAIRNRWIND